MEVFSCRFHTKVRNLLEYKKLILSSVCLLQLTNKVQVSKFVRERIIMKEGYTTKYALFYDENPGDEAQTVT